MPGFPISFSSTSSTDQERPALSVQQKNPWQNFGGGDFWRQSDRSSINGKKRHVEDMNLKRGHVFFIDYCTEQTSLRPINI
ncbi:MAG: hypothetical protein HYV02_08370 [Deltaproteobacteria bacterium]|nr:hypothetical protein [Deltaproteobacteria bacterium]